MRKMFNVAVGSEMPQTASAAGRQKYLRAHWQDRANTGLVHRSKKLLFDPLRRRGWLASERRALVRGAWSIDSILANIRKSNATEYPANNSPIRNCRGAFDARRVCTRREIPWSRLA
jgi:hypothetical protein